MKNLIMEASPIIALAIGFCVYVLFLRLAISVSLLPETVNGIIQ